MAGRTLKQLLDAATFRQEYWRGTYQDVGPSKLAISIVGGAGGRWFRNGNIVNRHNASGVYCSTAAVPRILDVTSALSIECVVQLSGSNATFINQRPAAGGFMLYYLTGGPYLVLYNNAGGLGRYCTVSAGGFVQGSVTHWLVTIDPVGLTCAAYRNGTPVATVFTNASAPANIVADTAVLSCYPSANSMFHMGLLRTYQTAISDDEAATLYAASRTLVTG